jgi:hypothetical protein
VAQVRACAGPWEIFGGQRLTTGYIPLLVV